MEEQSHIPNSWERINLGSDKLKHFFVRHLDRIYMAKLHLVSKLSLLLEEVQFAALGKAMEETVSNVGEQIVRMQLIYTMLDAEYSEGSIKGLSGLVEDAFESIAEHEGEPALQDLSIIFYLQNIESVEMASFQILQMAAAQLEQQQVAKLLKENYEQAKADRNLLLLISSKYMAG